MKKNVGKIILLVYCLFIFSNKSVDAYSQKLETVNSLTGKPYEFTIVPGSDDWNSLNGAVEKRKACFVPKDIMENMTTDALVETVLNYPLLIDIFAYNSIDEGIDHLSSYFQGVEILSKRSNSIASLLDYMDKNEAEKDTIKSVFVKTLISYLSDNQVNGSASTVALRYTNTYVYTPNYSAVPAYYGLSWTDHNLTQAEADLITYSFTYTYNSATIGGPANPSYNCHSFAWHSQLPNNKYWIDDPTPYFSDGSYTMTTSTNTGNRITYTTSVAYDHSGIIFSNSGTNLIVKSKWGCYGVLTHDYNDCPYYSQYAVIRYWH